MRIPDWLSSKTVIIAALALLVGAAGYYNVKASDPGGIPVSGRTVAPNTSAAKTAAPTPKVSATAKATPSGLGFFEDYRAERAQSRETEMQLLNELISGKDTTAQTRREAEEKKLNLAQWMEAETTCVGVLKAKGFKDAIVTISAESVNVIIKAEKLTDAQATNIMELVIRETARDPQTIKIIPTP